MSAGEAGGDVGAFIEARLAEDEAMAVAATPGPWWPASDDEIESDFSNDSLRCEDPSGIFDFANPSLSFPPNVHHIARHDPARVLAQVAALRSLATLAGQWDALCAPDDWPEGDMSGAALSDSGRHILRKLAAIWADHRDYPHTTPPEGASL